MVCDNRFPVSHLIETLSDDSNKVAGRSSQRHATLPTYYKLVFRTEKVLLCTTKY